MPEALLINSEKFDAEPNLVDLLAAIRYAIFAEGNIITNNGTLCRDRALLPVREKDPEDPEEPALLEKELEERLMPFSPFNGKSRDYRPIDKDPEITGDEAAEKFYSSVFHRMVRKKPEDVLKKEDFEKMNDREVEQWAYRQLSMLEKYRQSMDEMPPPTQEEVGQKFYSTQLTKKTGLSLADMAGESLRVMSVAEIEQWAQWELKGLENEAIYVRDFSKTIRKLKKIVQNGLMKLSDENLNELIGPEEVDELSVNDKGRQDLKRKKVKRIKLESFSQYVGAHEDDEQREALSEAIQESLIEQLLPTHKGGHLDEETTKKVLRNDLTALSRVANDYYGFLRGEYFDKSQHVALNAEVESCHNIGHLFLMAFDAKNFKPKVRREAVNKLTLMILLSELENYSKQNNEGMERMINILNKKIFAVNGGKKGKTYPHYLFSKHNAVGEVLEYEIQTKDREVLDGEEKEDLERRRFARKEQPDGSIKEYYVAMGNREKNLLQRLSKLIRENKTPGEQETDLNGFRFMVECKEDQILLMHSILDATQKSFEENAKRLLERGNLNAEARVALEELCHFNKDKVNLNVTDERGKSYIKSLDPIPVSGHKLKQLQSPSAIAAIGQDITQAPVFITEFKDTLEGEAPFEGSSASSSSKLRVLKYKLHVVNPERPGEYDQYEMQYYLPEGYLNMKRDQDLRHKRYGIERIFERLALLIFGEEIYNVNHLEAKTKALKKEGEMAA